MTPVFLPYPAVFPNPGLPGFFTYARWRAPRNGGSRMGPSRMQAGAS